MAVQYPHYCTAIRRDSTDGRAVALYPADPGSNPVVSMLQRALRLSVSAGRQTQLIMNRSWSRTLIVALLHWLDYKTLQLLLLLLLAMNVKNSYGLFHILRNTIFRNFRPLPPLSPL